MLFVVVVVMMRRGRLFLLAAVRVMSLTGL